MTRLIAWRNGFRGLVTVGALFLVFSTVAMAQVEHPSQISVQAIGAFTKDSTSDNSPLSHQSTRSGGFLVGYSYQFNQWIGAEGNYGYTRNTQNYFGSFGPSSIQADVHELTGSFVLHIPVNVAKVRPYALAGAGALIFDPTDKFIVDGMGRQTKAAFVYGGGVNYDITHNFGMRAEYRGLVYKAPDFGLTGLNLDKVTHFAQPSLGFFYRF